MRIVIDLQGCQSESSRTRGIGRYSMALAKAMARQAEKHEIWLAVNSSFLDSIANIRREFDGYVPSERFFVYDVPSSMGEMEPRNAWRISAAELIREYAIAQLRPDILHISSLFEGLEENAITSANTLDLSPPTAITLYDLIPLIRAETYLANETVRTWYYRKIESLKKAKLLLAISENSRKEALSFLGLPENRVVTVSTAIDKHFRPLQLSEDRISSLRSFYELKRPFVMYTGGIDSRKNIEGLIEAYASLPLHLRHQYQLAIVCSVKSHDRNRLRAVASRYKLSPDEVVLTGFVSEDDLVALYNLCELFVFPSLHEGFGLPALEAMACGAVVIGSNTSSIPEVIGRKDALFDPNRIESITEALHRGLTDAKFRQALLEFSPQQAKKFSWEMSATKAINAFEQLYEQERMLSISQVPTSTPNPKLAFISPLPPQQSGIADYSAELLLVLSEYYDITVIVDQPEVDSLDYGANILIQPIKWFEAHADEFERKLYQFGNSSFHQHMFELIEKYPGCVVLHDFYLSGALNWMDTFVGPPGIFASSLYRSHGYWALLTLFNEGVEAALMHFPMNRAVIESSTGVIVHSQYSKDIAEKWHGIGASKDWHLIPQIHTIPQQIGKKEARAHLKINDSDFIICSFGILAPTKLNHRLLKAWLATSLANDSRCHLIFVGENHKGDYGQQLLATIREAGMQSRITITGFVNTETYRHYLAAADMAIQLRTLSRGETSRAVLEVMLHKLPLIVNNHGTMADYPDDALKKLPDDFEDSQMVEAIEALYRDPIARQHLGTQGHRFVSDHHSPAKVAAAYHKTIESLVSDSAHTHYLKLLNSIKILESPATPSENDLIAVAEAIASNTDRFGQPYLLIDVSSLIQGSLNIENRKVVRNVLSNLLNQSFNQYRIEPIYFDGSIYRHAQRFTLDLLGLTIFKGLNDEPVDISTRDVFLGLNTTAVLTAIGHQRLMRWHQSGTKVYIVLLSDILNSSSSWLSERLENGSDRLTQSLSDIADRILCSSSELVLQATQFLDDSGVSQAEFPEISFFDFAAPSLENSLFSLLDADK